MSAPLTEGPARQISWHCVLWSHCIHSDSHQSLIKENTGELSVSAQEIHHRTYSHEIHTKYLFSLWSLGWKWHLRYCGQTTDYRGLLTVDSRS